MAIFQRLSELWQFVSPRKKSASNKQKSKLPTPQTEPKLKRSRHDSIQDVVQTSRSMSPSERIGVWNPQSPTSDGESITVGQKRKATTTGMATSDAGRRSKLPRLGSDDETDSWSDIAEQEEVDENEEEDMDTTLDQTLVVDDEEYTLDSISNKPRTISLPEQHDMRHISTAELRAQGWDDDYITLIQKIAMRGYEPLLPEYWKFDYRFLPDGLFESHDDAFICSVRDDHFRGSKALERLFELGGRVRDRVLLEGRVEPQEQVRRQLVEYIKWAEYDARLDTHTAIPILAVEVHPANTPSATLRADATRKCAELAERYRKALRVERSVEIPSPTSATSPTSQSSKATILSYPLPTFYAIVASYTLVAVMAYNPEEEEPEAKPMAFFDFRDVDYDVWNALALAITVCHVRDVQLRIAGETDLGVPQHGYSDESDDGYDDPDA